MQHTIDIDGSATNAALHFIVFAQMLGDIEDGSNDTNVRQAEQDGNKRHGILLGVFRLLFGLTCVC
jgi:hypothetical protein